MDSPLISILLPTYNGARFLREAIDSVERQTYPHWELIIIDDASRDETPRIIAEYEQNNARIRSIRNTENQKLVTSLNHGIDEAQGRYIARIDDDDVWGDPEKLAKQIARFSENPNL